MAGTSAPASCSHIPSRLGGLANLMLCGQYPLGRGGRTPGLQSCLVDLLSCRQSLCGDYPLTSSVTYGFVVRMMSLLVSLTYSFHPRASCVAPAPSEACFGSCATQASLCSKDRRPVDVGVLGTTSLWLPQATWTNMSNSHFNNREVPQHVPALITKLRLRLVGVCLSCYFP